VRRPVHLLKNLRWRGRRVDRRSRRGRWSTAPGPLGQRPPRPRDHASRSNGRSTCPSRVRWRGGPAAFTRCPSSGSTTGTPRSRAQCRRGRSWPVGEKVGTRPPLQVDRSSAIVIY
jgi:hypothetical protein